MTICAAVHSPPRPLPVGLQLVVRVKPLTGRVDRGVELEVEVAGKVLHVSGEGGCLHLLGVQLQEGPAEKRGIVHLYRNFRQTATPASTTPLLFPSHLVQLFQSFSPDRILHTAITHVISVRIGMVESHVNSDALHHVRLHHSNAIIM